MKVRWKNWCLQALLWTSSIGAFCSGVHHGHGDHSGNHISPHHHHPHHSHHNSKEHHNGDRSWNAKASNNPDMVAPPVGKHFSWKAGWQLGRRVTVLSIKPDPPRDRRSVLRRMETSGNVRHSHQLSHQNNKQQHNQQHTNKQHHKQHTNSHKHYGNNQHILQNTDNYANNIPNEDDELDQYFKYNKNNDNQSPNINPYFRDYLDDKNENNKQVKGEVAAKNVVNSISGSKVSSEEEGGRMRREGEREEEEDKLERLKKRRREKRKLRIYARRKRRRNRRRNMKRRDGGRLTERGANPHFPVRTKEEVIAKRQEKRRLRSERRKRKRKERKLRRRERKINERKRGKSIAAQEQNISILHGTDACQYRDLLHCSQVTMLDKQPSQPRDTIPRCMRRKSFLECMQMQRSTRGHCNPETQSKGNLEDLRKKIRATMFTNSSCLIAESITG